MKNLFLIIIIGLLTIDVNAQQCSNNVTSTYLGSSISVKKCYARTSPVDTGQPFLYRISIGTQEVGSSILNMKITDNLAPSLEYISFSANACLNFNQTGTLLTWEWDDIACPSGLANTNINIDLTVRFKEGVICNGTVAKNKVGIEASNFSKVETNDISITARAADGWTITKRALNPPASLNRYPLNPTVTYRITLNNSLGRLGAHNVNGVSLIDLFPPGAIIVTPLVGITPILDVSTGYYFYDVQVQYPASIFPDGSCPVNTVNLTGTNVCGDPITLSTNETICIDSSVVVISNPGLNITKQHYLQNKTAGCSGYYLIEAKNTGNAILRDLKVEDVFPTDISATKIEIINDNGSGASTLTYDYKTHNTQVLSSASVLSNNRQTINPLPLPSDRIKIENLDLPPNYKIKIKLFFTINSTVSVGTVINNKATAQSIPDNLNKNAQDTFTIENPVSAITIRKEICNRPLGGIYYPGDYITFRLKITNYGSGSFNGGVVTDVLPPELEDPSVSDVLIYTGNNSTTCSNNGTVTSSATDITASSISNFSYNTATRTITYSLPNIGGSCVGSNSYFIEFKTKIKNGTPIGNYINSATVSNGVDSDTAQANFTVNDLFQLSIIKEISVDGGITFSQNTANIAAGSSFTYRLTITNNGNMPMNSIHLIDVLPAIGDKYIRSNAPRGSTANTLLISAVRSSSNFISTYSNQLYPDTVSFIGATPMSPVNPASWSPSFNSGTRSIKISAIPSFNLIPLASEVLEIDAYIPAQVQAGALLCNDAVAGAQDTSNNSPQSFGSNTVCIEILEYEKEPCCLTKLDIEKISEDNQGISVVHTNGQDIGIGTDRFKVSTDATIPITEMRIVMTDLNYEYDNELCGDCKENPALWGSLISTTGTIGTPGIGLSLEEQSYQVGNNNNPINSRENWREVIWTNSNGSMLKAGDSFNVAYYLPPPSEIPCCVTRITVCYEITYKDANCQVCTFESCTEFALISPNAQPTQLAIQKEKDGCCEMKLTANADVAQSYLWSTGETSKSIIVKNNGTYSVTVSANGTSITQTTVVSELKTGAFPTLSFPPQARPGDSTPLNFVIRDYNKAINAPHSYNATKYTLWIFNRNDTDPYNGAFRKIEGVANCETGFLNGEIQWDGRDDYGNKVPSGFYNFVLRLENCTRKCSENVNLCNETHNYERFHYGIDDDCAKKEWVRIFPFLPWPKAHKCFDGWAISNQRIGTIDLEW